MIEYVMIFGVLLVGFGILGYLLRSKPEPPRGRHYQPQTAEMPAVRRAPRHRAG